MSLPLGIKRECYVLYLRIISKYLADTERIAHHLQRLHSGKMWMFRKNYPFGDKV
jgi:hypothetical protein